MSAIGVDFMISIAPTGAGEFMTIGGQRGATLSMTTDVADFTSKNNGSYAGAFHWYVTYAPSYRSRSIGGRLVYVPAA